MNLLLLLAALLPWAASPADALFRLFGAISLFSLEMQATTLTGVGSLYTLPWLNLVVALVGIAWQWRRAGTPRARWLSSLGRVAPWPALLALAALVVLLAALRPLEAADPYHLEKMAHIVRTGTLEYDPAANAKVNVVGWVYELVLADAVTVPAIGPALLRLHGLAGLVLYLLALATARAWLPRASRDWPWLALLVIPVVFHQFVLIKNDLFIAVPAFVALLWLVRHAGDGTRSEARRAGWLIGFVIGCKLTNAPLAVIAAAGLLLARGRDAWRPLGALAAGGLIGALSGGLALTLLENVRWYGDLFASGPVADMGNVIDNVGDAGRSVARFALSLVDLGQLTTRWWPGRGGWGGTFGLPFIWAIAVLAAYAPRVREARRTLLVAALHFLSFAAIFPDADVAQRLVLASGLLVVVMAAHLAGREDRVATVARVALVPVLVLSAAQIARSALGYLAR